MSRTTRADIGAIVRADFHNRRSQTAVVEKAMLASAASLVESRSLGHPEYENLPVGAKATAPMVAVFFDLTNFTGRTFWDDPEEAADLAHAILSGFIQIVSDFGGHPLGLRGDGLFAGFSPGDAAFTATMALGACAFALDTVENEVNPWLDQQGMARVQARAGLDFGPTTFVRSGNQSRSEINPIGFAANFAAKCEKAAKSWEIVVGEGIHDLLPNFQHFDEHELSPKRYQRDYQTASYRYFYYRWRRTLPYLAGVTDALAGTSTSQIYSR